jgi:ElaB/YqjD/DUF883 family membrane-anchored ribosome-binding protein
MRCTPDVQAAASAVNSNVAAAAAAGLLNCDTYVLPYQEVAVHPAGGLTLGCLACLPSSG